MAVTTTAVTVTTSATALAGVSGARESLGIAVPSGGVTVYIGGSDVTTSNGFPLAAGSSMFLNSDSSTTTSVDFGWYGIVAAATQEVRVLEVGV